MAPDELRTSRRPEIVSAVIRPGQAPPADFEYETVRLTDPALANRLAGFFDAYWSGPPSNTGIGAIAEFFIDFIDRDGEQHKMLLTPGRRWFMSSRGDWPLDTAFREFFQTLIG